ncbi:hypothetical protein OXPF_00120 [Oxobacter pfennigii]|uniref:Uncharacterized protein n=1 Tax=Oxobacter pfennigii TaxID=36849 RepID=A0A0P8YH00_9CLOT|nr:hypothetical protein [Oxobacter pfennigii]KPU46370.1 hypothetical protein OXPF_00120 [Oxobacter pfennigii]
MIKYIKDKMQSDISLVIFITFLIVFGIWIYITYTEPMEVNYKYYGIKYKAGNPQISEPIAIEISGKYKKGSDIWY